MDFMKNSTGSAGANPEPPQTPNERPVVQSVSSENADFQPGRSSQEAKGSTSPIHKG